MAPDRLGGTELNTVVASTLPSHLRTVRGWKRQIITGNNKTTATTPPYDMWGGKQILEEGFLDVAKRNGGLARCACVRRRPQQQPQLCCA